MAELDQNYEAEQAHEQEYDPEQGVVLEHENEVEHAHENEVEHAHENEEEHANGNEVELAHEIQVEHAHENEVEHAHEEVEHVREEKLEHAHEGEVEGVHEDEVGIVNETEKKNELEDVMPEDSHPDVKLNHADEPVSGVVDKWPGWPGESIFRMLVPAQKVGSIIGRKGEYIKKTCEETKARIKILDGPPGTRERAVMVSAKEEPDSPLPPAVDGLLRVLRRVVDGLESDSSEPPASSGGKVSTRLLVPAPQAGSLIGKQGATVKSIQEESNCIVRVLGSEDLPVFALQEDRVVEVVGEPAATQKAIGLIASHLRKFLVDRSIISIIEMQMQTPNSQMDHVPPPQHWGPPPQHGPVYGNNPHFMPPQQFDNYYPPAGDMARPTEKPAHHGISAYGREALGGPMHSSSSQAAPSVITQLTQQMQIPLTYADAVIGTQGASISYIRRVSGATVAIQETRGLPGEMTVEISGTASQVQTAQQLIQNCMAEAAGAAQTQQQQQQQQQQAPSAEYSTYGSYAPNPSSNPPSQSGGYGPVYGNSYGY